jgi:peptide/nickel transport system substrate-binding protein
MTQLDSAIEREVPVFTKGVSAITREFPSHPRSALPVSILRSILTAVIALTTIGCSSDTGHANASDAGGALVIALPVEPASFLPPLVTMLQEKQIADQVYDMLANIGPDLNTLGDEGWTPRLAESWQWGADSLSITFKLRPDARFHDGQPVTSSDLRFSLDLFKDPKVASRFARSFADVDSIATPDSLTAVIWYSKRSPEQFYNVVYNLLVMPEHALRDADRANLQAHPLSRHPLGSGPFRFERWQARTLIEVRADSTSYHTRPRLNRIVWVLTPDNNTALNTVLAGEADVFETVTTDAMASIAGQQVVRALQYHNTNYGYLGFNLRDPTNNARPHPLLADRELRRALSMAVDRTVMLRNVYDSLAYPGSGPFSRNVSTADSTLRGIPFDSAGAGRLLDSLGWRDGNGDGVRENRGRKLSFSIMVPASSPPRRRYAELLQAQLKPHGVELDIDVMDVTVLVPRMRAGQFDAVINSWVTDPSPGQLRDTWHTMPVANRANNFQLYSNPVVDAAMDSATRESDPTKARALYRRAYQQIIDDVPAIWLYENRMFMAINKRIQPVFNGKDVWWRQLDRWSIPADQRLPRDK